MKGFLKVILGVSNIANMKRRCEVEVSRVLG